MIFYVLFVVFFKIVWVVDRDRGFIVLNRVLVVGKIGWICGMKYIVVVFIVVEFGEYVSNKLVMRMYEFILLCVGSGVGKRE